ncbi:MAG: GTP 3',8-cyclase MoaA [Holophagales bacterium]|nr:GTP 3',8-cyclase MoaA [Holophagales bacterium]
MPVPNPTVLPRDTLGRPLEDLRISVTDRCNFRCTFCMPAHRKYQFLPRPQILSYEEVLRLTKVFVGLGVRKVRLTGGEPLLRSEIETLISGLSAIPELRDLALTTNAYLLGEKAESLKEAGLDRVTVSLHSLDPQVFGQINGLDLPLERVLEGIRAARDGGLGPVKLNVVVMKGVNDGEIEALARFGRSEGAVVRFIEYMDVGTVNGWDPERVISAREILDRVSARWPLEPVDRAHRGEVANRYRYLDGGGEVGVIPSITQPFCGDCTRARLSAEGKVYTCLFGAVGHDLRAPLRDGSSDEDLRNLLKKIWRARTDRYSEERTEALLAGRFVPAEKVEMFRIGG